MSNAVATIDVEVAYALPEKQFLLRLTVPENTTAMKAIELSGLMQTYPDLDVSKVGIFSQLLGVKGLPDPCSYQLAHLDRVEIYPVRRHAVKLNDSHVSGATSVVFCHTSWIAITIQRDRIENVLPSYLKILFVSPKSLEQLIIAQFYQIPQISPSPNHEK